ncbi:MAG: hypothetical protein U9O87_08230 [Verrucomicrobiota bacterium]|nr:hypothetical protein [Verrucomicrobiota bacterium]
MKKRNLIFSVILIMLLAVNSSLFAYSGGSGTEGEPYQIATTDDLIKLSTTSSDWDKYFIQTANISFDEDENQVDWDGVAGPDGNGTSGFSPIGNRSTNFTGNYAGDEHTIDNLYINRPYTDYIGLFGFIKNATITNTGVTNVNMTGKDYLGGLVGANSSTISNSYSTGSVDGDELVPCPISFANETGN